MDQYKFKFFITFKERKLNKCCSHLSRLSYGFQSTCWLNVPTAFYNEVEFWKLLFSQIMISPLKRKSTQRKINTTWSHWYVESSKKKKKKKDKRKKEQIKEAETEP